MSHVREILERNGIALELEVEWGGDKISFDNFTKLEKIKIVGGRPIPPLLFLATS